METWAIEHWLELVQIVLLGAGLFAAVLTLRTDINVRRVQNLINLTSAHREIWSLLYDRPHLSRVLDRQANLIEKPITLEEERFVHFLILHLRASFKARQIGFHFDDDELGDDIEDFFTRPIPKQVWQQARKFQEPTFVKYVEVHLNGQVDRQTRR